MNRVIWSVPLYLLSALNPLLPANRCLGILVAMWRSDSPLLPIRANFLAWKRMNLISLISISSRKSKVSLRKSKFWHCSNLKFFFFALPCVNEQNICISYLHLLRRLLQLVRLFGVSHSALVPRRYWGIIHPRPLDCRPRGWSASAPSLGVLWEGYKIIL